MMFELFSLVYWSLVAIAVLTIAWLEISFRFQRWRDLRYGKKHFGWVAAVDQIAKDQDETAVKKIER